MDPSDTGYFAYNQLYPPLFIEPMACQEQFAQQQTSNPSTIQEVQKSVLDYMEHCKKEPWSHQALLPNGLQVGEASLMFCRYNKAYKKNPSHYTSPEEYEHYLQIISQAITKYIGFEVNSSPDIQIKFRSHLSIGLFQGTKYSLQITSALKLFLKEMHLKKKGYTKQLKLLLEELDQRFVPDQSS